MNKTSTPPRHHLPEDLLLDHAAGSLSESVELLVATHLALCPACRDEAARLETLGGAMIDTLDPEPMDQGGFEALFARIEAGAGEPEAKPRTDIRPAHGDLPSIPRPLRDYVGKPVDELGWKKRGRTSEARLMEGRTGEVVNLLRIPAGATMPEHTHRGAELTLVLEGGFSDEAGHYLRGDLAVADESVTHRPHADEDGDCLCLTVTNAPVKLTGPVGRLLNPFLRA